MRVLHIIPDLDPDAGGPPVIALSLASAQAVHGCDVSVVGPLNPLRNASWEGLVSTIPGAAGLNVRRMPPPQRIAPFTGGKLRLKLRDDIARADVVHIHGVWETFSRNAAAEALTQRKPYFYLVNGMLDPWSLAQKAIKKKIALMLIFRKLLNGAAALQAGNADEKRLMLPLALKPPVEIIPNGIFLEQVEPLPPAGVFRAAHPELGDHPYVLFLSRLHYKKGLDYLADAFVIVHQQLPDVRLVVAGPDGGERQAFVDRVAALGVASHVQVVGPIYGRDKFAAYVDASCFCLPSRQEGFSMAITESLATGTPAVVSDACHFGEVATSGAGFVVPLEPPRIADALIQILSRPDARQHFGSAGRRYALEHLTWPVIARQTMDMYARHARTA